MSRHQAHRQPTHAGLAERIAAGEDSLIDLPTTAQRLGTTVGHVRELIRTGRLGYVRVGRFMRVPVSALAAYLRETIG